MTWSSGVRRRVFAVLAAAVFGASCASSETADPAPQATAVAGLTTSGNTAVVNARVFTLDGDRSWAASFAYDAQGVIIAVGSEDDVLSVAGDDPTLVDAGGRLVLPGFQDTHVHVPEAGINEGLCLLSSDNDLATYADEITDCVTEQSDSDWVRAAGASLFNLRDTDELPIDVLDEIVPDRPAVVLDDLGHAAWTNTLGLEAAGIGPDDVDPQGGIFHRDARSGRLTGLLLEDAQQRVRNVAAADDETNYQGLLIAMDQLAEAGVTSISDAGGYWAQNHTEAWETADAEGTMLVRAANSLYLYPALDMDQQLAEFASRFTDVPGELLQFDTVKIYIDGILDLGTALMIEPYDDPVDPNHPSGFRYFEPSQLQSYVSALHRLGYRMEFHVIGDGATRAALDAIEGIDADPAEIAARRHRTTHTYLVDESDIRRFAQLGVLADFQVGEDSTDLGYHDSLVEIIGERAYDLLDVPSALEAGAIVSLSSDWDADPLSPVGIIENALTRESHAISSVETAIEMVTINAARALGHDTLTGSIELGKFADYVILDRDLLEIPTDEIGDTNVLLTVLAGAETHRSARFSG